ncbi:hypothetical protein [Tenacibaculum maritimum]|nr:hypothetical protein [Tenacibaculum maritimum]
MIKRAKNYHIFIENTHNTSVQKAFMVTADGIHIEARNGALNLISNKKVVNNGGGKN